MAEYRIVFMPIKHGDQVSGDVGLLGISGAHKFLGFQPRPRKQRAGWAVFAVNEEAGRKPRRKSDQSRAS